jgi:hypothetical protein
MQNSNFVQKQANSINLSLLALKECIRAYSTNKKKREGFIPFRRSVLTMALKPIFTSKSSTSIICTLYPKLKHQTIDTLKYASNLQKRDSQSRKPDRINEYGNYISQIDAISFRERRLWYDMKKNNQFPKSQINKYLDDKISKINKFKRRLNLVGANGNYQL